MKPLFGAFQLVDQAFNSSAAGLSPSYIATLGYFVDRTQVIAYGPFQPVGPLGPGSTAAIGIADSSQLQSIFEGGLKAALVTRKAMSSVLRISSGFRAEDFNAVVMKSVGGELVAPAGLRSHRLMVSAGKFRP